MMRNIFIYSAVFLFAFALTGTAQKIKPAQKQSKRILILNATAHLGNGSVIQNSAIGFKDGKLVLVGDATRIKYNPADYDTTVKAPGRHIYPGFIATNIALGLTEVDAVRATLDYHETGAYNPDVRSLIAFNTDSKIIPTVRSNGVLIVQATPRGGVVSGSSSAMQMDAWNWEDAVIRADEGIHMNWPRMFTRKWTEEEGLTPLTRNKNYEKEVADLNKFFADALAYSRQKSPAEVNIRFESMKPLFNGTARLYLHVNLSKEIMASVDFAKSYGIKLVSLTGADDAYLLTDFLKKNEVSVVIGKVHELPKRRDDDVDLPYKIPSILTEAGIKVCLSGEGQMEAMNSRNLPFWAGTAAAHGLDKEQALKMITLHPAELMGIDSLYGSIEEGKSATFFISEGDALDMRTNQVVAAFIDGREIDLDDHQKALNRLYLEKYGKK